MVSNFNKNAIINGLIDYFCLVCETYFTTEEAAEQHMEKQIHKKNLEASTYVEKYKHDYIRKVKAGYFCEYCNKLLSTGTKVSLHIKEEKHKENKGIALLRYLEHDVMFNDVVIKEEAWHGFCRDTCAICNCEVEDFAEHKADHGHLLKLVQGRIQFGPNNSLYRKVDELTFQCVTCNKIFASSTFEKHFYDSEHQEIYISPSNIKTTEGHYKPLEKISKPISAEKYKSSDDTTSTSMEDSLDEKISNTNILIDFLISSPYWFAY